MAYMIAALVLLSLACFVAVIVGTFSGAFSGGELEGLWPAVTMVPLFALPVAMLLTITLLIISAVARGREGRKTTS